MEHEEQSTASFSWEQLAFDSYLILQFLCKRNTKTFHLIFIKAAVTSEVCETLEGLTVLYFCPSKCWDVRRSLYLTSDLWPLTCCVTIKACCHLDDTCSPVCVCVCVCVCVSMFLICSLISCRFVSPSQKMTAGRTEAPSDGKVNRKWMKISHRLFFHVTGNTHTHTHTHWYY